MNKSFLASSESSQNEDNKWKYFETFRICMKIILSTKIIEAILKNSDFKKKFTLALKHNDNSVSIKDAINK